MAYAKTALERAGQRARQLVLTGQNHYRYVGPGRLAIEGIDELLARVLHQRLLRQKKDTDVFLLYQLADIGHRGANVRIQPRAFQHFSRESTGLHRRVRTRLHRHPKSRLPWRHNYRLERHPPQSPSRPGEFHPEPLTEPCLNLSIHTARTTH